MPFLPGRLTKPALLAAILVLGGAVASAQSFPAKPIKIVVGFGPGGSTDIVARLVADQLAPEFGQAVIVENKAGAGGRIAAGSVAGSPADGYTLLMGTAGTVVQLATGEQLPFNLLKDFAPVILLAQNPHVLVVHPSVPAHTVAELAALARSRGDLNYASAGEFTSLHIAGALFGAVAGAKLLHVPYKSGGAALTDLLAGRVQMMFADLPTILPQIRTGAVRALAVTGKERSPLLPDVPTMTEAGFAAVDTSSWFGLMVPTGTPPAVVELLNTRVNGILGRADVKTRFSELGLTEMGGTPAEYSTFLKSNVEFWKRAVELSGTRIQQ